MRIQKRLSAVLLTLLLSCALVLTTTLAYAAAANPLPDPDWSRNGSCGIGVRMLYNGKTVPGGSLELYKVGDVEGNQKTFTLNNDFSGMHGVSLGDFATEQSARLAQNLANYANRMQLKPLKIAVIDENGYAEFNDLAFGLYLVVQDEPARGYEAIDPFLVSLPMYTKGEGYDYFVNVEPKVDKPNPPSPGGSSSNPASEPESSEPTSSEPTSSEPTSSQPESSEPTSSEPTSSQPESSQDRFAAGRRFHARRHDPGWEYPRRQHAWWQHARRHNAWRQHPRRRHDPGRRLFHTDPAADRPAQLADSRARRGGPEPDPCRLGR